MARTKTITFKVEPAVATRLEDEADEEDMSRSEYLRKVVKHRGKAGSAMDEMTRQLQDYRAELDDRNEELRDKEQEIEALEDELRDRDKKIRDLKSRITNVDDIRQLQQRMVSLLQKDLNQNSARLGELAQDVNSIEDDVGALRESQREFIDRSAALFDDILEALEKHRRDAEKARFYMEKVWNEFRRYHKQDFRSKMLRKFGLIDSIHDLAEKEPELTDDPAKEHPSDN